MGARLMAGQQTLNLYVEVRLLCAQLFYLMIPRRDLFLYMETIPEEKVINGVSAECRSRDINESILMFPER